MSDKTLKPSEYADYELILGPNAPPSLRGSVWKENAEGQLVQIKGRTLTYSKDAQPKPEYTAGSGLDRNA